MSRPMLLPALAAIGALLVGGWFYLGTRQTSDLTAANAIVNSSDQHLSVRQADHALSLLHSAAVLNPDRTIDLDRSRVALKTGHPRRAYRLARAVADAEPQNAVAWEYVFQSTSDPAIRHQAAVTIGRLVPPPPR